ncbi:MAG: MlaD family protein [Kofleriaceae bacterium]
MRWVSRLVTTSIVVLIVGGIALLIRSQMPDAETGGTCATWTKFRDGSRLAVGSPVVIAGVRVGDITKLSIEDGFARVDMALVPGLQIPADSFATRRADSLFGDSYLEIMLGGGDEGATTVRYLKCGEPIAHVVEGDSTDAMLRGIARAMPKIDNALELVHEFMVNGRKWVSGPGMDRMSETDRWLSEGHIERPITRIATAMESVEDATTRGAAVVADMVPVVTDRLAGFDRGITDARGTIADAKSGLIAALSDAREGMNRLDKPVADMTEVMSRINQGEGDDWRGTLGRLVNDPALAETLEDVSESAREAAAGLNRFRSWIGGRFELNVHGKSRVYVAARLAARNDTFYLIEAEKSGLGGYPNTELDDAPGVPEFTRRQEIDYELRFTAQIGKRFGPFALRGGLKDSTPGAGADLLLFKDRLEISADVFGAFDRAPRLKLAAALEVFRAIYVIGGIDDALNPPGELMINSGAPKVPQALQTLHYGRDYFVGVGLYFTDADLSTLVRIYGALLVGMAAL